MVKLLLLTVAGSTGSLICSMIGAFNGTFVALLNGFTLMTAGGTRSGPVPVVNVVAWVATELPATSVTPLIVSVITVLSGSGVCGTSWTVWLLLLKLIESGTSVIPPPVSWMLLALTVNGLIGLLNNTTTCALSPTFVDPLGGDTDNTVGFVVSGPAPVVKLVMFTGLAKASPFVPWMPVVNCT